MMLVLQRLSRRSALVGFALATSMAANAYTDIHLIQSVEAQKLVGAWVKVGDSDAEMICIDFYNGGTFRRIMQIGRSIMSKEEGRFAVRGASIELFDIRWNNPTLP